MRACSPAFVCRKKQIEHAGRGPECEDRMDFFELKQWLKAHDLTFKLEGWSGCIPDTILIFKDKHLLYEGDYHHEVDYSIAVREVEEQLKMLEAAKG